MRTLRGLALLSAGLAAGCVHAPQLVPAPGVQEQAGEFVAVAQAGGVRVVLDTSPWKGSPGDLTNLVTPVKVTIENNSGSPLAVQYGDFALRSPTGFLARALPPFRIQRPAAVVTRPYFPYTRFYIAGPYAVYYPWLTPWSRPFAWDPTYYESYYTQWSTPLPTRDMLERALPEGVLERGGSVTGYLYFQRVSEEMGRVGFHASLKDADTRAEVAAVSIPLLVR